jgi:hypothetical protein
MQRAAPRSPIALRVVRRIILASAMLLAAWGVIVAATGGVDVRIGGVAIRSRDPFRAVAASVALLLFLAVAHRSWLTSRLDDACEGLRRRAGTVALAAAAALALHGVIFGSFTIGGSDSYGYVNQAYDWVTGRMPQPIPLPLTLPFEMSDLMQIPLAYVGGGRPHTMIPLYPPGLSLLMALSLAAGACGPYFVVPIFAALFAWLTFRLGVIAGGRAVGVVAAVILIACPVVLYQAMWPMSDIPAGALWTGAVAFALGGSRRSVAAAGLCAAVALLVRPNLLMLLAAPLLAIVIRARGRERLIAAALLVAPSLVAIACLAALFSVWTGSPSNSGYGDTSDLFQLSRVWTNLQHYVTWFWQSQPAWVLLLLVPFVPPFRHGLRSDAIAACMTLIALTLVSYLTYRVYDAWWYLRFLMPAFGALAVLAAAGVVAIARTVPQPFGRLAAALALYLTLLSTISYASGKAIFGGLREGERRYLDIAEFAAEHMPTSAAIFSMQHSGSLRFYSGRLTLRYDWVQPEWASKVPAAVERAGYHPYLIVDDWEIPEVRRYFGLPQTSALPWPVVARRSKIGAITVFDMATSPSPVDTLVLEPGSRHWCAGRARPPI